MVPMCYCNSAASQLSHLAGFDGRYARLFYFKNHEMPQNLTLDLQVV